MSSPAAAATKEDRHAASHDVAPTTPHAAPPSKKVKPPRKKPAKSAGVEAKAASATDAESATQQQQQKQRDKEFVSHKSHILANLQSNACDLSPKGSVDAKCLPVMGLLNTQPDYITTSSCSGRIALFHSIGPHDGSAEIREGKDDGDVDPSPTPTSRMKRGEGAALGWVFVKHGMLRPEEMVRVVHFLCGKPETPEEAALDAAEVDVHTAHMTAIIDREGQSTVAAATAGMFDGEVEGVLVEAPAESPLPPPSRGTVSLKMEPFVMHVECRTMEAAKALLSAAVSDSGYRNSGVIPPGRKIMCGIRSTVGLGLDVPVVVRGVNYVAQQRAYIWALLRLANEKMEANEKKIKLLEKSVAVRVGSRK
ncbi:hypothetical protein ABB37_06938 [Leptomonas pyrrhocoris]|uniref:tRNA(Phe) 7-[(3-amino-3-carboxypropyl)-4-demethylwyosine(37)-N(4)]-methyltransferase n=1 Tax=Leptomonas pyrrhocoris TaxID=157538 RepID=A0A0M9FWL5_LEPPY|nr:hypothetical protein ABB37_06938 [Leptomonas pyrrhocoris]KPA77565.1 hypothetical protein ABB37_06938 [Leptomonas pyrrhocoris]|eukprot:XP_015656004.1 hypothetical protein ABB37_06938 [Leptomonas pyrrhocoris]